MASRQLTAGAITKPLFNILRNFHLTLFFVLVIGALMAAVILINRTITDSENESTDYTSSITPGSIDEATLLRLQSLQQSGEPRAPDALPEGRINPLSE